MYRKYGELREAVFDTEYAQTACPEERFTRVVKCQSSETQIQHRVEAVSELSRAWLFTDSLF